MKVCHVINRLSSGGAQQVVCDIVRNAPNVEHTICCLEPSLSCDLEGVNARIVELSGRFKFDPLMMIRFRQFVNNNSFDVLHLHLPYSQIVGRTISTITGVNRIVSTFHSPPEKFHPLTRTLERITRPRDTVSVAVSKGVQRANTSNACVYTGGDPGQWCTIFNGIDVEAFNSKVNREDTNSLEEKYEISDGPVFLNVSRYIPEKSQRDAIDAMVHVVDEYPSATLFIAGRGPLKNDLRQRVADRGLEDNVKVPGFVSQEELYAHYSLSDAFVLSSVSEGFGIVLIEAMAARLPVVATDIPGVNEVVSDGETGRIVPPRSPKSLAAALLKVVETEEQCAAYGAAGYDRALRLFDARTMADSYTQIYEHVVSN